MSQSFRERVDHNTPQGYRVTCKKNRMRILQVLIVLCMTVPLFLYYVYIHVGGVRVEPVRYTYSSSLLLGQTNAEKNKISEEKKVVLPDPQIPKKTTTSSSTERSSLLNRSSIIQSSRGVTLPEVSVPVANTVLTQDVMTKVKHQTGLLYPDWWQAAYLHSAVSGLGDEFVGDRPLFPPCVASSSSRGFYSMVQPKRYISQAKNPCWFETKADKTILYCIPYFYVAGVAKCGTSDLYRRIRLHPDVMRGTMKEYHWWDRSRFDDPEMNRDGLPFKDYSMMVTGDVGIDIVFNELKTNGTSVKIFGDGSPSYFWELHNWPLLDGNQGCLEPRVVIGQHILHLYPNAKMILTFRHPRTRLYSRFLSRVPRVADFKGATAATFHQLVVRATRLYRRCFEQWSIRHCAYNLTLFDEAITRLMEGMYPVFMADWLRIFPRQQMHIIRYEDYAKDLEGEITKVFKFLDLAPLPAREMAPIIARVKVNVGDMYEKIGPMLPETAAILDEFYQPFMTKLAEILNDERFLWKDIQLP